MWGSPLARVAAGLPHLVADLARARLIGATSAAAPALAARIPFLLRAEESLARFFSVKPADSPADSPPGAPETTAAAESSPLAGKAPALAAPRAESASPDIALTSLDFTEMREMKTVIVDKTGAIADLLAKRAVSARAVFTRPRK
jgi:hypothetical protein